MQRHKQNNAAHPATKTELDKALTATKTELTRSIADTKAGLEQALIHTEHTFEQLLADQVDTILEAVDERFAAQDERMDKKFDKKFDIVITALDSVMKEVQAHREEDVMGAAQLRRHDDQLLNHEQRIATLEISPA